jgi:transcriptional regulator with XRE-family HTH domain
MIAQRLKEYRLARGMSLDDLAASIGGIVTKQALSKYEMGRSRPSPVVLNKLASVFGIKAAFFWSQPPFEVRLVAFRKGSRLPKKEHARVEGLVRLALEDRVRLQELSPERDRLDPPVQSFRIRSVEEAEAAAEGLRRSWSLGLDPIACITGVLEDRRIHVLEIESERNSTACPPPR